MQHCIVHSPRGTFPWRTPMMLQWRLFRMLSQQLHAYHLNNNIPCIKITSEATSHMLTEHLKYNSTDWSVNDLMAILGCAWPSQHITYLWDTVKSNEHLFSSVRKTPAYHQMVNYFNSIVNPPLELICYIAAMSFVIIKTPAEHLNAQHEGSACHQELKEFFVANTLSLDDLKTAIVCAVMANFRVYGIGKE